MSNNFLDHIAASSDLAAVSKVATAGGAASAVIFGIDAQVVGIWAGIIIGLTGLIYNVWATERTERRRRKKGDDGN